MVVVISQDTANKLHDIGYTPPPGSNIQISGGGQYTGGGGGGYVSESGSTTNVPVAGFKPQPKITYIPGYGNVYTSSLPGGQNPGVYNPVTGTFTGPQALTSSVASTGNLPQNAIVLSKIQSTGVAPQYLPTPQTTNVPTGMKVFYDKNGEPLGIESSEAQRSYLAPKEQTAYGYKFYTLPNGQVIQDINKYVKENKIPTKQDTFEFQSNIGVKEFLNKQVERAKAGEFTPSYYTGANQNVIIQQGEKGGYNLLESGAVSPVTAEDITSTLAFFVVPAKLGMAFGRGAITTAQAAGVLFREPITAGANKVMDIILPQQNTGFDIQGMPYQIARGYTFVKAAELPLIGTAYASKIGIDLVTKPYETVPGFVEYAKKNPYEVATVLSYSYLPKFRIRELEIPKENFEPVKVKLAGLETKGGRSITFGYLKEGSIGIGRPNIVEDLKNLNPKSEIKIGSPLETSTIAKNIDIIKKEQIAKEETARANLLKEELNSQELQKYIQVYHATQMQNIPSIMQEGLIAGKTKGVAGENDFVYTAISRGKAEGYKLMLPDGEILSINVPKEEFFNAIRERGVGTIGQVTFEYIPPEWIEPLSKKSIEESSYIKVSPRAEKLIDIFQDILRRTKGVKSKFIDETELLTATERLPKVGVKVILDIAKENQGILFGSKSRAFQLAKEYKIGEEEFTLNKVPRDVELRFDKLSEEQVSEITKDTIERLQKLGKIEETKTEYDFLTAREIKDTPNAIEVKVNGVYEKVAEFKAKGSEIEGEEVPEYVVGIKKTGKTMNLQGVEATRLEEELRGVSQGVLRLRRTGNILDIFPSPKRMKDIGSVVVSSRTLAQSKIFNTKLYGSIEKFEALFPRELILEQLKKLEAEKTLIADFRKSEISPSFINDKSYIYGIKSSTTYTSSISKSPINSFSSIPSLSPYKSSSTSKSKSSSSSSSKSSSPSQSQSKSASGSPYSSPSLSASISKSISPFKSSSSSYSYSPNNIPSFRYPKVKEDVAFKRKKQALKKVQAYNVLIRRRGKFRPVATGLTRGEALAKGSDITLKNLARTFKIVPTGQKEVFGIDEQFMPKETQFRSYIVRRGRKLQTPNQFIQLSAANLQTPEEKMAIRQAKLNKRLFQM